MRDYKYLPYEKAIEQMAKEYAKIRPRNDISKNMYSKGYNELQNCYMNCLEFLMLFNYLPKKRMHMDKYRALHALKQDCMICLDKVYKREYPRPYSSPVVSRMPLMELKKKLKTLQDAEMRGMKIIASDYDELRHLQKTEEQVSELLDKILEL